MLRSIIASSQLEAMKLLALTTPPGDFAEVGVFHGGSARVLYSAALEQNRKLHLFDTFTGTPVYTEGLDRHKIDKEFADEDAPRRIRELMPLAHLYVGVYPDTHPKAIKELAFVHCDCDQYESYCSVIRFMWPLVVSGGIMLFDDYPYLAGAKKAVEENFPTRDLKLCSSRYYVIKELSRV